MHTTRRTHILCEFSLCSRKKKKKKEKGTFRNVCQNEIAGCITSLWRYWKLISTITPQAGREKSAQCVRMHVWRDISPAWFGNILCSFSQFVIITVLATSCFWACCCSSAPYPSHFVRIILNSFFLSYPQQSLFSLKPPYWGRKKKNFQSQQNNESHTCTLSSALLLRDIKRKWTDKMVFW